MVVRLRLAPHRRLPSSREVYFRIIACNGRKARDSKPLETVGVYDHIPQHIPIVPTAERSLLDEGKPLATRWIKRVEWDKQRLQHWIKMGAQPTKRVAWLMEKDNLIPPGRAYHGYKGPSKPEQSSKTEPSATTPTEPSESNSNPSAAAA